MLSKFIDKQNLISFQKPAAVIGESAVNGILNGHVEENIVTENVQNNTKIVTETTTKTKVVTSSEEKVVVNKTDVAVINGDELKAPSPTKSPDSSNPPSELGSTADSLNVTGEKSQKVKKQKSFKKALMKKLHKKEEKSK